MKKALILNYHLIDGQTHVFDAFGEIYAVKLKDFERQMLILKECNIRVVSLNNLLKNNSQEEFTVALTFDDGNPSDFELAFPILKKYGYTATFFLSLHNIGKKDVTWEQYRQMIAEGFEIGSHSLSHRDLSTLDTSQLKAELQQSKQIIEEELKIPIQFLSLPFGMYNANVIRQAQLTGYHAIFTTKFNYVLPLQNPFLVHRWSIKRKTSLTDFKQIVQNNRFTIKKYTYVSSFKRIVLTGFGSALINKIYTFKSKYF